MAEVTIRASDGGSFSGYLARPSGSGKFPALVVIQEIFGVNQVMREITDAYAAQGYVCVCPDIFWRQEPGIQITDKTQAEWDKAFSLFKGFDEAKGIEDLKATSAFLRGHESSTGKVGTVGYCLGGRLATLMAARSDIDAAVGYYPVGLDNNLDEAAKIRNPLMLHVAEKDKFVPPEAQAKVREAFGKNPKVTIHTYPGQDHAFARIGGEHYDPQAAKLANERTAQFFKQHLKG
jgi:carboxymethylenebutenolidase